MSEPHRLHPAAIFILGIRSAVRIGKGLVVPFAAWIASELSKLQSNSHWPWLLAAALALLGLAMLGGILEWHRCTYRVVDGELRVEHGVLVRKQRFIPAERIQSIDLEEDFLHRVFRVVKVRVLTAGGSDDKIALVAVSRVDAERLRASLWPGRTAPSLPAHEAGATAAQTAVSLPASDVLATYPVDTGNDGALWDSVQPGAAQPSATVPVCQVSMSQTICAGLTSGRVGMFFTALSGLYSVFHDAPPLRHVFTAVWSRVEQQVRVPVLVELAVALLIAAWLASTVQYTIRYANFRLFVDDEQLVTERGLISRRRISIPRERIQAIRIVEGLLRQPFGFVEVHAENAGFGERQVDAVVLHPFLRREDVPAFLAKVASEFSIEAPTLSRLPLRARRRYLIRTLVLPLLFVTASMAFVPHWGWLSLPVVPGAFWYGWRRWRYAGWGIEGDHLYLRTAGLARTFVITTRRRVQSCSIRQSWWQRRAALASFRFAVASGLAGAHFGVVDLELIHAIRVYEWLRPRSRQKPSA
jgi:putative membrane protein